MSVQSALLTLNGSAFYVNLIAREDRDWDADLGSPIETLLSRKSETGCIRPRVPGSRFYTMRVDRVISKADASAARNRKVT
jgi:hypothetical protein